MIKDLEENYTINDIIEKYGRASKPCRNYKTGTKIIANTDCIPYICDGCKKEFLCEFRLIKTAIKKKHYCSFKCKYKFTKSNFEKNEIKEKIKNTWLAKYGVAHPWKDNCVREKCYDTNKKLYGNAIPIKTKRIKEKSRETTNKNYGVNCGFQTLNNRKSCNSPISHEKRHNTQKTNKTYAKSKPEDAFEELLRNKSIDYVRHKNIKVDEKRFNVDFYVLIEKYEFLIMVDGLFFHALNLPIEEYEKKAIDKTHKKYSAIVRTYYRDIIFNDYCQRNSINLIRFSENDLLKPFFTCGSSIAIDTFLERISKNVLGTYTTKSETTS